MERRDFLLATGGVIAAAVSAPLFAQVKPCPPSPVGVAGGTTATTTCTAGPVVPTWTSSPVL